MKRQELHEGSKITIFELWLNYFIHSFGNMEPAGTNQRVDIGSMAMSNLCFGKKASMAINEIIGMISILIGGKNSSLTILHYLIVMTHHNILPKMNQFFPVYFKPAR